jgi:hypothetical protein
MNTVDLFGDPVRKQLQRGAYAGHPGMGPKGETCGTCTHSYASITRSGRRYYKCAHVVATSGPGTDIRLRTPACERWEPTPPEAA